MYTLNHTPTQNVLLQTFHILKRNPFNSIYETVNFIFVHALARCVNPHSKTTKYKLPQDFLMLYLLLRYL